MSFDVMNGVVVYFLL